MDDTSQSVRQGANGDKINSTLKLSVNSTRLAQKQLLLPLVASCSAVMSPKIAWMFPQKSQALQIFQDEWPDLVTRCSQSSVLSVRCFNWLAHTGFGQKRCTSNTEIIGPKAMQKL